MQVNQVLELAAKFGLQCLASQCEELKLPLATGVDYDLRMSEQEELMYQCPLASQEEQGTCPLNVPVNTAKLLHLLESGAFSDVQVMIEDYGKVAESHRLVLSAWSEPFAKVSFIFAGVGCTCEYATQYSACILSTVLVFARNVFWNSTISIICVDKSFDFLISGDYFMFRNCFMRRMKMK